MSKITASNSSVAPQYKSWVCALVTGFSARQEVTHSYTWAASLYVREASEMILFISEASLYDAILEMSDVSIQHP